MKVTTPRMTFVRGRLRFYLAFCTSLVLLMLGVAIVISAIAGQYLEHDTFGTTRKFLLFGVIEITLGALGWFFFHKNKFLEKRQLTAYEAFATITWCWCIASFLGAIPLLFQGVKAEEPILFFAGLKPIDAVLESFSMFTTTGSILSQNTELVDGNTLPGGVNGLPGALIFYRCLCAWFGGMGTIALIFLFLPLFRQKNQILPCAELSGLKTLERRNTSPIAFSALKICSVYLLLTIILCALLWTITDDTLTLFDAFCCAFTTISTSGTGSDSFSVFSYGTPAVWIITVFLLLASCNFNIYVLFFSNIWKRLRYGKNAGIEKVKYLLFNDETLFFLITCFVSAALIAVLVFRHQGNFENFTDGITASIFAAVSCMSTTGFTPNPAVSFPVAAVMLLSVITIFGGCSGSTSSGLKAYRCIIIFKQCIQEIKLIIFPHLVPTVYLNHERRDISAIHKIFAFFALYMMVLLLFAILFPVFSPAEFRSFSDAFSLSLACLTNTGLVCTQVSGTAYFDSFNSCGLSPFSKLLMCFEMLLGRLEIYTILVLFLPHFGKDR